MEDKRTERRESFIQNLLGESLMDFLSGIAIPVSLWGTVIILVLFGLTFVCHWQIVCNLFSFVSGFTLITIAYVLSVILVLDLLLLYKVCNSQPTYSITVIWGVCLILLGISFVFFSGRYKKQYKFDCSEWLLDESAGLYHFTDDCEEIGKDVYVVKGYELREGEYDLCEWCKEYMEDMELSYEPIRR